MAAAKCLAALVVACGVGVGGCSSSTSAKNSQSPKSTSTSRAPVSAPTTNPPAPTSSIPSRLQRCTSSHLSVALGEGNGAAGTIYFPLTFTNTATSTCTLEGYPGVSLVGSHGDQIGSPSATCTFNLANGGDAVTRSLDRRYGEPVRCPQYLSNAANGERSSGVPTESDGGALRSVDGNRDLCRRQCKPIAGVSLRGQPGQLSSDARSAVGRQLLLWPTPEQ